MSAFKEAYLEQLGQLPASKLLTARVGPADPNGRGSGDKTNVGRKPREHFLGEGEGALGENEQRLTRLKPTHRRILLLHLMGLSSVEITIHTGFSAGHISRVIRDPLSQPYIEAHLAKTNDELEAMFGLAVDAVRRGLNSDSEKTALAAADRFFRVTGRYGEQEKSAESAEDVIKRALQVMANQSGTIDKLVDSKRIETAKVIDMRPTTKEEEADLLPYNGDLNGNSSNNT